MPQLKIVFKKPYIYLTIITFLVYLLLAVILSGFYNTIPLIIVYAKTINWFKLAVSISLSLFIGILIAINTSLIYIKYKQRKACKEGKSLTGIGAAVGLAAGVCPLCVSGIFPLILGLLGISFSFASLPFQGIEVQILALAVLLASIFYLKR